MSALPARLGAPQLSLDDLGTPLREVTFVVLDLETTGGRAAADAITEVGAVKVRGGEQIGELATLVDPGTGIPPAVVALTGITSASVLGAPPFATVLPSVLEFLRGAVLVAHNSPFDVGFLRAACERHGQRWPRPPTLCTARLARRVLSAAEAPSVRLAALADLFGTRNRPTHRALADARATVEVLHALLERVGNLGVHTLEDLLTLARHTVDTAPTQTQRRKRHLADGVPHAPGVYLFRGARGEVLYVGTSADLQRRVRSYFTGSVERSRRRRRMREMVLLAERVETVVCAHALEAEVRELRLLAAHQPRYNRRSLHPHRAWWVVPTDEAFPRLSVVTTARDGSLGPFGSRRSAVDAVQTLTDAVPIRRCTQRIAARDPRGSPCVLAELGRCAAPCAGRQSRAEYLPAVAAFTALVDGRDDAPLATLAAEVERLGAGRRFEEAARRRDALAALISALGRAQRMVALAVLPELVAARPDGSGGWELAVVRYGRLASAGVARRGVRPMPVVDALVAGAQTVLPESGPLCGAPVDEVRAIRGWLTRRGTRLVRCPVPWTEPARGAGGWAEWAERAASGRAGYPAAD